ncbi:hypothetical protein LCGC14_2412720 [marine sediment metagenome]|uniref:Uncharacterized protein n=1 Tax=marine sediment metagenome TaxID=412755 RepID=A0A0F9CE78_9ZZZZ
MLVKISCQTELHPDPKEGAGHDSYTAKIKQRLSLYKLLYDAATQLFGLGAIATEDMRLEYWESLESSGNEGLRLRLLVEIPESFELCTNGLRSVLEHLTKQGLHVVTKE